MRSGGWGGMCWGWEGAGGRRGEQVPGLVITLPAPRHSLCPLAPFPGQAEPELRISAADETALGSRSAPWACSWPGLWELPGVWPGVLGWEAQQSSGRFCRGACWGRSACAQCAAIVPVNISSAR